MTSSIKSIAFAIVMGSFIAGPAHALITQSDLNREISSLLGADSNVTVSVHHDLVTLTGYFSSAGEKNAAIAAIKHSLGGMQFIDHTQVSS